MEQQLISKKIEESIQKKIFPGCVIGWIKNGKKKILPFGKFTYEKDSTIVKKDSIYDVASITKVIPSSSLILMLINQNKIGLEDPIIKYIPEFGNYPNKKDITIKHLLTYTLDLIIPSMASLKDKSAKEIIETIITAPLRKKPGLDFLYTNATANFLGLIIERVTKQRLDKFAQEYLFDPLNMSKSTFHPLDKFKKEEIVPTEVSEWIGDLLQGMVHDESTYVLQNDGRYLGVAGLFSTAPDILKFAEMILNKGSLNGKNFFSEDLILEMSKDQLNVSSGHIGLGWEMNIPSRMGKYAPEIIGKSGFTGCMLMINLKKQSCVIILSNSVYPKRPLKIGPRNELRRNIADIIFEF